MLSLDRAVTPDPFNPVLLDTYGRTDTPHECIVADIDGPTQQVMVCRLGVFAVMPSVRLPIFLRSIGVQPQGRMVGPRKESSAVGSADWILEMGPALRRLREAHGIRLGELARTLGCPVENLSAFELGEAVGAPRPLGTAAMDLVSSSPSAPLCKCGHGLEWHAGEDGQGIGSGPACHCGCECFTGAAP